MPSIVTDWMSRGLEWSYASATKLTRTTLKAGEMLQLPQADYIFKYPEGVVIEFSAAFDHPSCGIRLEQNPSLDTGTDFTVTNATASGFTTPDPLVYALVPPASLPGWYTIRICSQWPFQEWMRLYVFNTDSVPHTLLGHGYHLAVLKKPRPDESIVPLKRIAEMQHMMSLYPDLREPLARKLEKAKQEFLDEMKIKAEVG